MTEEIKKTAVPDDYLNQYDGFKNEWISTSALSCLMTCGLAFKYRYIDRLPEPGNVRKSIGIAAHKARELNLSQKVTTDTDLPVDVLTDATRDSIKAQFEASEVIVESEFEGKSVADAKGIAIDMGVEISAKDRRELQPEIHPTGVEKSYAVEYAGLSRTIVGKVDVDIDTPDMSRVIDFKTGKRAYGQDKVDSSMQISTYGLLKYATSGVLCSEYIIHNIAKGAKETKVNVYKTTRTLKDLQRQLDRFATWMKVIDSGLFAPCDPGNWKCSPEWCGYWKICKFGGK